MKVILFLFLILLCVSFGLNYALSRRIDNLTTVLIYTQDFQDKYLYDILKLNNLQALTITEFEPPKQRTFEEIQRAIRKSP